MKSGSIRIKLSEISEITKTNFHFHQKSSLITKLKAHLTSSGAITIQVFVIKHTL